jgi:hypothetical protein
MRMMSVTRKLDLLEEENHFNRLFAAEGSAHCAG